MDPEAPHRREAELRNEVELRKMETNPPTPWLEFGCVGLILLVLALLTSGYFKSVQ